MFMLTEPCKFSCSIEEKNLRHFSISNKKKISDYNFKFWKAFFLVTLNSLTSNNSTYF